MRLRSLVLLLMLAVALPPIPTVWAQQKCFTEVQVSNMVRDGFGDESGAKLIERRGIDFASFEDSCQSLKPAAANEAFLNALRAPPSPPSSRTRRGRSTHCWYCWYSPFWWAKRIVS